MIPAADFFNDEYFAKFETKKYRNPNPLQRKQIAKLLGRVVELAEPLQPKTILDAGAGEGFLTEYLAANFPQAQITVVDLLANDLALLKKRLPQIETHQGDLETFETGKQFDLVVATEVFEHLFHPEKGLERFAAQGQNFIFTVPHEPIFMLTNLARGKNVSRLGNDIEHVNHWYPGSFKRFLSKKIEVDSVQAIFPWIVASGHRRA